MGGALSSENPNNSSNDVVKMSPNSPNPDPKSDQNQNPDPKTPESQNPEISDQPINPDETGQTNNPEIAKEEDDDEEEEEGECGFCLFMKGGGCKDQFVAWEQCVEDSEKNEQDIVEKCFEVTANLKKCMEAHSDYYEPILRAEKAAEEDIKQELDREAESKKGSEQLSVEENAEISVQN